MLELTNVEYPKNDENFRYMFLEFTLFGCDPDYPICATWIGWDSERQQFLFFGDDGDEGIELIDNNDLRFNMTYNITDEAIKEHIMVKLILDEYNAGNLDLPRLIVDYMI